MKTLLCILALSILAGCNNEPIDVPNKQSVEVHILPAVNHGCEIICKDGICTITCPFTYGCKPEGEAVCVVENGEIRNRMGCCQMYTACHACKCLKDGIYKGYCKDGVCTYKIPVGE